MTNGKKVQDRYYMALLILIGTLASTAICITDIHSIVDESISLPCPYDDMAFGIIISIFGAMIWYIRRRYNATKIIQADREHLIMELGSITTGLIENQKELKAQKKIYKTITNKMNDGIISADADTMRFIYSNTAIQNMLGYTGEEMKNLTSPDIHPKESHRAVKETFKQLVLGEIEVVEGLPTLRKDGSVFYTDISASLMTLDSKKILVGFFRDVTNRVEKTKKLQFAEKALKEAQNIINNNLEEELAAKNKELENHLKTAEEMVRSRTAELEELTQTDSLTGLYNRYAFDHQLIAEVSKANRYDQNLSILMLDLDDFKIINDTKGHQEGDKILCTVGQVISESIRQSDIAFRYGGDEFAVILPFTAWSDANLVATRIARHLKDQTHVYVSIGTTQYGGESSDELFDRADKEMYSVKSLRKECSNYA